MISSASSGVSFWRRVRLRDGDGTLCGLLTDHMLIEFDDNLTRREFVQCELFFFGGAGEINGHK